MDGMSLYSKETTEKSCKNNCYPEATSDRAAQVLSFASRALFFFRQLGCNLVRWYSQLQANTMKTINLWKIEHLASWRSQINLSFALVSSSSILVKSLQIWICATTFDTVLQAPVNVTCEDCPQLLLKQSHKANPSLCILIQQCWIVTYVLFFCIIT